MRIPRYSPFLSALILGALFAPGHAQDRGKKKDDIDDPKNIQAAPLPRDPPDAVLAETGRLVFHVSPLSAKGLLSQQVRDALKALNRENHGATIVKLRAFVASTGDLRRVQSILDEETPAKQKLPALSTIQVGGLGMEGAQVVIESVGVEKKSVNPSGLAFFSGQRAKDARSAVAQLQAVASAVGVKSGAVLRVTCFVGMPEETHAASLALSSAFPAAGKLAVLARRLEPEEFAECEAVARLDRPPGARVMLSNPPSNPSDNTKGGNPGSSQVALVNSPNVVLTGSKIAFHDQDSDLRLVFQRLEKAMEPLGATDKDVFWWSMYPLTSAVGEQASRIGLEFFNPSQPPAGTRIIFEGLPSVDASVAIDLMAASSK